MKTTKMDNCITFQQRIIIARHPNYPQINNLAISSNGAESVYVGVNAFNEIKLKHLKNTFYQILKKIFF